jgi:hypothetical protein
MLAELLYRAAGMQDEWYLRKNRMTKSIFPDPFWF